MPTGSIYFKSCCYTGITYYSSSSYYPTDGGYVSVSGHTLIIPGVYQTNTGATAGVSSINIGAFGSPGTTTDTVASACTNTALTCASSGVCININSTNTYIGYSSTYYVAGSYGGHPYWSGSTCNGFIYFNTGTTAGPNWCLSSTLGTGGCFFFGSNPTSNNTSPDLDSTIYYSGNCIPQPTPNNPCFVDFDVSVLCFTPTPVPTLSPTPTPSPSATPQPTPDLCSGYTASISGETITPTPTPNPTATPQPTPTRALFSSGVTFVIDDGNFMCNTKELVGCSDGEKYYIEGPLAITSGGTIIQITTGQTIQAVVNGVILCVKYTKTSLDSVNSNVSYVISAYTSGCTTCFTPTPTATQLPLPTPGPTPAPTATPSYPINSKFIFTSCTSNSMIIQSAYPPYNISIGDILKTVSGECYNYIGDYVNYNTPSGFMSSNQNMFTGTTATTYTNCISCLVIPKPTKTYNSWSGKGAYSVNCPLCQLTDFGSDLTFYTLPTVTQLQNGVTLYSNQSLLNVLTIDYVQYGNKIYNVDTNGVISEKCTINGNC